MSYSDNGNRVLFDPHRKVHGGLVCISHGHSDHARKHDATMLMTPETKKIVGFDGEAVTYGKSSHGITFYNAGHVLGSAQCEINGVAYTGDFLMDSPLLGGAEPIDCDTLVMETTFGLPEFAFPKRQDVIGSISKWVKANYNAGRTVILGGYSLGKAQELTKIVTDMGIPVLAHPKIARINQIYENAGIRLGGWLPTNTDEAREIAKSAFVAVMPFHQVKPKLLEALSQQNGTKAVAALATGWALRGRLGFKAFPLSDHADFPSLLSYVEQASPRKIYTIHGFANEFARQLRRRGWKAEALKPGQKKLTQWDA